MKRLMIAAALACAVALPGCGDKTPLASAGDLAPITATVADAAKVPPPATVANKTALDEQLGRGVELAYKAFRLLMEARVDSGKLTGAKAVAVADLDNKAFKATQAVQAAYRTANAVSYSDAVKQANAAIAAALAAIGRN